MTLNLKSANLIQIITIIFLLVVSFSFFANAEDLIDTKQADQDNKASNDVKDSSSISVIEDSSEEEVDELDESNITTKVYKSNDPALDLIEDKESMLDPTLESEILNKDELIGMSKVTNRKAIRMDYREQLEKSRNSMFVMLPWLVSIVLIALLVIIFRFFVKKSNS